MDGQRQKQLYAWLEARKTELEERLERIEKDVRHQERKLDADSAERAVETRNDDVLAGLDTSARSELDAIRDALARLERGDYGTCTGCGEPISMLRLRSLPSAERCISCAEREK